MIPFSEAQRKAQENGVPLETIEKDYCVSWILLGFSMLDVSSALIFYGGTALKKIYFPSYRFSYDIDFKVVEASSQSILDNFSKVAEFLKTETNIECQLVEDSLRRENSRTIVPISYDGFPEVSGIKEIELDLLEIDKREIVYPAKRRKIVLDYSDFETYSGKLRAYGLDGIFSDKLATILETSRMEPRDLYDLWYLLKYGRLNFTAISTCFERKCGFKIPLGAVHESIRDERYSRYWETRLRNQVRNLPDINDVLADIDKGLNNFKSVV